MQKVLNIDISTVKTRYAELINVDIGKRRHWLTPTMENRFILYK